MNYTFQAVVDRLKMHGGPGNNRLRPHVVGERPPLEVADVIKSHGEGFMLKLREIFRPRLKRKRGTA